MIDEFSRNDISKLEKALNYQFKNLDVIHEALSHPSLKQHELKWHKNYERFEILGDAILGFLITEILFNKYQKSDEGNIAKIKAYLVSKETICKVATKINLGDFIIMTKGEEVSGGRKNPGNIENTMEALIAGVYIDSDIATVRSIVTKLWSDYLDDFDINEMDPKTALQEWSQGHKYGMPHYEVAARKGPVHMPHFTVSVSAGPHKELGDGSSIKSAQKEAAKKLLDRLGV